MPSTENNPILLINFAGYETREIQAHDGVMNIQLREGAILDEVVVTGYSGLSGSVGGVSAYKRRKKPTVPTSLVRATTSYRYDIEGKLSLPSTSEGETVFIRSEDAKSNYVYQAFPKLEDLAFLTAEVENWSELQILPGSANIYLDNRYIGQTNIDDTYRENGEKIISLGQDRSVSVTRVLAKNYKKRKSLGKNIIEKRKWEIIVENQRSENIKVLVKDQYPISKDSDIKVDLREDSGASMDKDTGQLTWEKHINSGQSLAVVFEYEVKAPKNRNLLVE